MASTQPEQSLSVHGTVGEPLAQQKPRIELSGPAAEVSNYLSAMVHNSFTMNNLLHSCQDAFAHSVHEHIACHRAYVEELEKNRTTTQALNSLKNQGQRMVDEINRLRNAKASLQNEIREANASNENLQSRVEELKSVLGENQCFTEKLMAKAAQLMEESKSSIREPQDDLDAGTRPVQTAERYMLRLDGETYNDTQDSPAVAEGLARMATVLRGGELVEETSRSKSGSEGTDALPYNTCTDQAQVAQVSEHSKRRSRLRRQSRKIDKSLIFDVSGTAA